MFFLWITYRNEGAKCYLPNVTNWLGHVPSTDAEASAIPRMQVMAAGGEWSIEAPKGFVWEDGSAAVRPLEDCHWYVMQSEGRKLSVFASLYEKADTAFVKLRLPERETLTIGSRTDNMLQYAAPTVSRAHGALAPKAGGGHVYTDRSSYGSYINGAMYTNASRELQFGDVITILPSLQIIYLGDTIAVNNRQRINLSGLLRPLSAADAMTEHLPTEDPSVVIEYHRAPRHMQQPNTETISIDPPLEKERQKPMPTWLTIGPSVTMVLPMLVSSLVNQRSVITSLAMMGTSSALAIMWGSFNRRYQKQQRIENEADRQRICQQYYAEMEELLAAETERERKRLMYNYMSVEECLRLPAPGEYRLWERMPSHEDFLAVRLGLGECDFPMPLSIGKLSISLVDDPLRREPQRLYDLYHVMRDVPILMDLSRYQIVGVLSSKASPWLLQSIVVQVAAMHSYHDVRIAVIHDETDAEQWQFAKWLPHAFASDDRTLRLVVSEENAIQEVCSYLDGVLAMRVDQKAEQEAQDGQASKDGKVIPPECIPWYVVICTDPKLLEDCSLVHYLTASGLGFTLLLQTPTMELLPKECRVIIESKEQLGSIYHTDGIMEGVQFDLVAQAQLNQFAKRIAPFRIKEIVENSEIPSLVTFLETYNVRRVEELDIRQSWNENHAYQSVKTILGYKAGNVPFVLDISFKNHGPHGLIAGTTGAGKSVLLQTFILSLAINYSPQEVQFILIDYKGGGTSEDFRNLPHAAGVIDSLQGERVIYRALASIKGEILRREQLFKEGGVNDIDDYMKLYNNDPNEEPLGHLIIIVDEFAELKKEQPEFMSELVSAARVGRSLGLHLVLATQKPSNSVSNEIEANTRFRICLRVASKSDSSEMLKRPEAAYLKGMGRCYVQVGNNEVFEQVQTSYSGGAYAPNMLRSDEEPRMLNAAGQPIRFKRKKKATTGKETTELSAVLDHIIDSCDRYHFERAHKLWLEELAEVMMLEELPSMKGQMFADGQWPDHPEGDLIALYGMADDIDTQRHLPAAFNLTQDKNELIVGLAGSGKTTLLQTIAVSLALRYKPSEVVMYVFSLTSRALNSLRALPHVGDIVFEDELDNQIRLMEMIAEESERRKKLFAGKSTDNYVQYNRTVIQEGRPEDAIPAMVVLVDRMQQLRDWAENRAIETKLQLFYDLLRSGASQGIYFVITAFASNELPGKYQPFVHGTALQLNDRAAFSDALGASIPAGWAGIREYPGRGVIAHVNKEAKRTFFYEIQTAIYGSSSSDSQRSQCIETLGQAMRAAWSGSLPPRIPRIPENPVLSDFLQEEETCKAMNLYDQLPLGYAKRQGVPLALNLREQFSMLISGAGKSGKTSLLRQIAIEFLRKGAEVHVIGDQKMVDWARARGMNAYIHGSEEWVTALNSLTTQLIPQRSNQLTAAKAQGGDAARSALLETFRPVAILVDDMPVFIEKYAPKKQVAETLANFTADIVSGYGIYFYATMAHSGLLMNKSKAPLSNLIAGRRGIALQGRLNECDPFDSGLPSSQKNMAYPVGEGLLISERGPIHIVLPLCDL